MRKIVLILAAALALTGLALTLLPGETLPPAWRKAFSLLHIWGGQFFIVVFALYAWDHISTNRRWLRRARGVTLSGATQTLAAAVIIGTGVVLLLYGEQAWEALRTAHHWLTYLMAASIVAHFLSPKSWR